MLKDIEEGYGANPKKLLQQYDTEQLNKIWMLHEKLEKAKK